MKKTNYRLIKAFLSCLMFFSTTSSFGQGNNSGLGGNDANILSIGERLFNLEKKSEAFQLFMNMKVDYTETLVPNSEGAFHGSYFRPEMKGTIGKWSYRIRLNLNKPFTSLKLDKLSEFTDYLAVYFKLNEHWSFAAGKKILLYGTFENEWNPLNVIQYHEFINNVPCLSALGVEAHYSFAGQTFGIQVANADRISTAERYPQYDAGYFENGSHPFQYSFQWVGSLFGDKLKTIWAYSLINQAKSCFTNQITLGTALNINKWSLQLDYSGAFGRLDYLGLITADQNTAGSSELVEGTSYNGVTVDIGYWPTPRLNLFVKAGLTSSSADNIERYHKYRKTIEYTAAAQFILDPLQDMRISLAYIGKNIRYSQASLLENQNYGRIELALIYRLKAY